MNAFVKNILATLVAASVVANVTCLYQFNARLARIETYIQITAGKTLAQNE